MENKNKVKTRENPLRKYRNQMMLFIHIAKTAGTTLNSLIVKHFPAPKHISTAGLKCKKTSLGMFPAQSLGEENDSKGKLAAK